MTSQQVTIRQAKPYDVSNLCRLLEQVWHDAEGEYPEPDQYRVINWVTSIINDGYVVVAEKSGRLVGTIALTNYQFPWSPKWYLYTDWMYVSKSFREGGVFDALLTAIHAYADERKAPIFGGIHSGKYPMLKDRLMQQRGYKYLGGQFLRTQMSDDSDEEIEDGLRIEEDYG